MKSIYAVLIFFFMSCSTNQRTDDKYVKINDNQTAHFVSLESSIPMIQLDIRYHGENNFIGKRIDGYNTAQAFLIKNAADSLSIVQKDLQARGLGLLVYDAYRPQVAVDHFVRWAKDYKDTLKKADFYPKVPKSALFEADYIASRSGHSRGSTVDLTLIDIKTGEVLDMGSEYDFFGEESWPSYSGITVEQKANRMLLQELMLTHGFVPYPKEWWHFTLKNESFPDHYFNFLIE